MVGHAGNFSKFNDVQENVFPHISLMEHKIIIILEQYMKRIKKRLCLLKGNEKGQARKDSESSLFCGNPDPTAPGF